MYVRVYIRENIRVDNICSLYIVVDHNGNIQYQSGVGALKLRERTTLAS